MDTDVLSELGTITHVLAKQTSNSLLTTSRFVVKERSWQALGGEAIASEPHVYEWLLPQHALEGHFRGQERAWAITCHRIPSGPCLLCLPHKLLQFISYYNYSCTCLQSHRHLLKLSKWCQVLRQGGKAALDLLLLSGYFLGASQEE